MRDESSRDLIDYTEVAHSLGSHEVSSKRLEEIRIARERLDRVMYPETPYSKRMRLGDTCLVGMSRRSRATEEEFRQYRDEVYTFSWHARTGPKPNRTTSSGDVFSTSTSPRLTITEPGNATEWTPQSHFGAAPGASTLDAMKLVDSVEAPNQSLS